MSLSHEKSRGNVGACAVGINMYLFAATATATGIPSPPSPASAAASAARTSTVMTWTQVRLVRRLYFYTQVPLEILSRGGCVGSSCVFAFCQPFLVALRTALQSYGLDKVSRPISL